MPAERVIDHRIERGRLHPIYPGVYAVGHRVLTPNGHLQTEALRLADVVSLSDRELDRALKALGWEVIRVTWLQLHESPKAVEADLRALLATPAP